jgi:transaldolase / glucose-6-phosphate isomerase
VSAQRFSGELIFARATGELTPGGPRRPRDRAVALETYTSIRRTRRCDYDRGVSDAALTLEARIPGSLAAAVAEQLRAAASARVSQRLTQADATLWGPASTPEVANRLGWLTIAERMLAELDDICAFADRVRDDRISDVVLLGMGGSSLAPEVLRRCFPRQRERPALHVLDSTDAAAVRAVEAQVQIPRTLFVVSSKSGGTIEPLSLFAHFWALSGAGESFAAITDPGSGLEQLARAHGFRRVFAGDPDIGGRYSALSAFGIVPGALIGADVAALLNGAPEARRTRVRGVADAGSGEPPDGSDGGETEAGVWLGAALSALARAGRDKLTFIISSTLPGLGLWLEQLVAESTGKHGRGILPVAEEPLGEPEQYGEDRVFAYLPDLEMPDRPREQAAQALAGAGHPVITVPTRGPGDLGRVFMLWEIAVAVAGWGLQINPFDQPNVQQAKDATNRVLAEYERSHELPELADADAPALDQLLAEAAPPQYVAIMGYLRPTAEVDAAVSELRVALRRRTRATTTFGYGPRFLHSTGQFHKGGPKTGRFLQLLHDEPRDIEIPGAPYGFTTLKNAQATGDLQTLRELGLPAERVRLRGEPASAVLDLVANINRLAGSGRSA